MKNLSTATWARLDTPALPPAWRWDWRKGQMTAEPRTLPVPPEPPAAPGPPQPTLDDRPAPPQPEGHPDLRRASTQLAHVLAETLDGKRRLTQLEEWFDADSLAVVSARLATLKGTHVRLGSVRIQPVNPRSAEVALRLATARLDYAAALRVSRRSGRWVCTDLVIG